MRAHAILGAGGVGGFVAAILAHAGERVILLLRPESRAGYPGTLTLESPFGNLVAPVQPALVLEEPVDVLWVATKATQLSAALEAVPDPSLARMVVPLLNGVDHVSLLRSRFPADRVVPATIAGELERTAPGKILHRSPFAGFVFSAAGAPGLTGAADILSRFGCSCRFEADELTMLWRKLVMLAPMALTTTATGLTLGELKALPEWAARFEATVREACAVARAAGAMVEAEETLKVLGGMPATLRSSMQKDVAAGRPPELDAIAGPILRGGSAYGIPVPATTALAAAVQSRRSS
ncbi:MAG TPA: 2-dehydropantoate 2-reductase [Gemmatimonadales bacterium]|nr:2-dehydropantoate 2-reductase [Gemmatimonadales bacterium]